MISFGLELKSFYKYKVFFFKSFCKRKQKKQLRKRIFCFTFYQREGKLSPDQLNKHTLEANSLVVMADGSRVWT